MNYSSSVVEIRAICRMCGGTTVAVASEADFERWVCDGEPIQRAMPEATPDVREAFIGWRKDAYICPRCWPEEPEG